MKRVIGGVRLFIGAVRDTWKSAKKDDPNLTIWGFIKAFFKDFSGPEA